MGTRTLPRRLAAVWFADIVGYSRRVSRDEDDALRLVRLFQRACAETVRRTGGRVVKFTGDGALAEFPSTEAATRAACALPVVFDAGAESNGLEPARLRVGVHVGDVATAPDGDIYGDGVNVAARLEGLAEPGQVVSSRDVWKQLRHRPEFAFELLGEREIKGSDSPIRVFGVSSPETGDWEAVGRGLGSRVRGGGWHLLVSELKRRHVFHVAGFYVGLILAVIQIVIAVFPSMGVPAWGSRAAVALVFAGFPVALILAWAYDVGPEGFHRDVSPAGGIPALRRARLVTAGLGVVIALAGIGFSLRWLPVSGAASASTSRPGTAPSRNRLAVLYFDDFTEDHHLGYLVDGLTETLIHELGQVPGLQVVSRNGVKPYENSEVPVDSIARALDAGTLVQGSVAESDDRLRVNVQLIDGSTGTLVQSETLERSRGELFALQDDLARRVAEFLRKRMGEQVRLRQMRQGSHSVEAWELVQRAEEIREETEDLAKEGAAEVAGVQYDRADSLLARAEALDPKWAEPAVQRGWLAFDRSRWRKDIRRWIDVGLGAAERALGRAPDDADALELRGTLRYWSWLQGQESDPAGAAALLQDAEKDLRAAIAANPDQASAWATLSSLLAARGATVEALIAARKAYESDAWLRDADVVLWRLFTSSYDLERAEEAAKWCAEGRTRFPEDPDFAQCRIWLMTMPQAEPDPAEAWRLYGEYRRLAHLGPGDYQERWARMAVAAALARAGLPDSAAAVAREARADRTVDPAGELAEIEAFVDAVRGDHGSALALLKEYLVLSPGQRSEVAATWWFSDLRDDPAFQALVRP